MALQPGTTLGPYEVTAKIGEGGMGEVYRARDTKLDRDVALKVLPQAFTDDPDRLARFEREAKVLASLNHPNIGHIYGLEEAEGQKALVLELVEGPTLADRIAHGAIPLDEALPIAKQIAEALEAAHEAGVIHRDLKPANIKVKDDGTVKVLDFGLAKAFQPDASDVSASMSPTISLTAAATQMGMVIGTAAYMAPEQASGKPVDKRADIWAFGAVLYEMLTGQRLFSGEDVSHTLAYVLTKDIDWTALSTSTPETLRRLLHRCLERDPRKRLRDIGEARVELEEPHQLRIDPTASVEAGQLQVWQRPIPLTAAALAFVALTVLAMATLRPSGSDLVAGLPTRAVIPLPAGFRAIPNPGVAWSPDGRTLIYAADSVDGRRLYRQRLDESVATPFGDIGRARQPFFSLDGGSIGFFTGTELRTVPADGGPPETLYRPGSPRGGVWTADGSIILAPSLRAGLARFSPGGGELDVLTVPDRAAGERCHRWPFLMPDGETVLFTIVMDEGGLEATRIAALSLASGEVTEIQRGSSPRYVTTGHLVFVRPGTLWAAPFDPERLEVTGAPRLMVEDLLTTGEGGASFDVAASGSLAYVPGGALEGRITLQWVSRDGAIVDTIDETPRDYRRVRLSPDGRHVAAGIIAAAGGPELWLYDIDRPTPIRLAQRAGSPVWSVDSRQVLFSTPAGLWSLPRDRSSADPELVLEDEDAVAEPGGRSQPFRRSALVPQDVSLGQQLILAVRRPDRGQADLMVHDLVQGGPLETFAVAVSVGGGADLSPDGRWLAYVSDRDGQDNVYVQAFPVSGGPISVSLGGGRAPRWAPDGRELFFRVGNRMMAVGITTEPEVTVGTPQSLFDLPFPPGAYDIAADGRFVMGVENTETATHMNVVLNWTEELKRLVPTN